MHPIENIMQTAMSEIKEMVDVNTVIGDPVISTNGSTIIPVSRVCFGFVSGGGEYGDMAGEGQDAKHPFSGGAGSGVSINPIGFLVVDEEHVELISVNGRSLFEHVVESIPHFITEVKEALKRCRYDEVE